MVKVLIFDLWDTVASKNMSVATALREKFGFENYPDYVHDFEDTLELAPLNNKEEMAIKFLKRFNLEVNEKNITAYIAINDKAMEEAHLIEGIKELLIELRKKYKLILLSNSYTFEFIYYFDSGLNKIFDDYVVSYEVGVRKPSKEIYEIALKKAGVDVSECVFVDNTLEHVEVARKLGMKGIHFVGVEELKRELKKL